MTTLSNLVLMDRFADVLLAQPERFDETDIPCHLRTLWSALQEDSDSQSCLAPSREPAMANSKNQLGVRLLTR